MKTCDVNPLDLTSQAPWSELGRARAGRGRWVDAGLRARKATPRHGFQASQEAFPAGVGRSVDVGIQNGYDQTQQKSLISSDFSKPSDGLEPSTPSLP